MYSNCAGQLGKLAGPLLTNEIMTLRLLLHTLLRARPWDVDVSITPRTTVRVYSDASFEHGQLRLGWNIFGDHPHPRGAPVWFQNARDQQIFFGETLAGLLGPTRMCSSGGTVFGSSTTQELYLHRSDVLLLAPKTMFINLFSFRQCWFTPSIPEYGRSGPVGSPCSPFAVS